MNPRGVILIMLDGFGIPAVELEESIYAQHNTIVELLKNHCVPLDASLGVKGIPQSATGQTALFTGVNAAKIFNLHIPAFPGPQLRKIIEEKNLFSLLNSRGISCTFANGYIETPGAEIPIWRRSVTTVMSLNALPTTRNRSDIEAKNALTHDITRKYCNQKLKKPLPIISAEQAALDLWNIAKNTKFTLFEYFLTDFFGHRGNIEQKNEILQDLDLFIKTLIELLRNNDYLLLITSDHGNIEQTEKRTHSMNKVPWIASGKAETKARKDINSILGVPAKILELLS